MPPGSRTIVIKEETVLGKCPCPSPFCPSLEPQGVHNYRGCQCSPKPISEVEVCALKTQKRSSCHGGISALRSRGSNFGAISPALCPRQNLLHSGNILLSDKAGLLFIPHILLGHRMPGKDFTFPRRTLPWDQTHWGPKSAFPITPASNPGWATGLSHCTL